MRTLSRLGIGLSLVFGCLFFALLAEVYYLLWWKKKRIRDLEQLDYGSKTRLLRILRRIALPRTPPVDPEENSTAAASGAAAKEITAAEELMRAHNLAGPPRFLFTIKEETKEEMEDAASKGEKSRKSSRGRTMSDVLLVPESPLLSPLPSPATIMDCYSRQGFNPLFESAMDDRCGKVRASPPPTFKFLRDAEEKLFRKVLMEEAARMNKTTEDGSFLAIVVGKNKEHHPHSISSQVIPLSDG
ncbi:uncharacterized protein LOC144701146 [Wolffia australiana]